MQINSLFVKRPIKLETAGIKVYENKLHKFKKKDIINNHIFLYFPTFFPFLYLVSPVIIISPPPAVPVNYTYTFVINCTATGIPTPEIVWRLNWGHTPDKCSMTSTEQAGNRAFGVLTCPNAMKEDSGIKLSITSGSPQISIFFQWRFFQGKK